MFWGLRFKDQDVLIELGRAVVFGACLTFATYMLGISLGWIKEAPSIYEFFGTALNYSCVILAVYQRMTQWVLGIIAVLFLGKLFYDSSLYASMALSLGYFLPVQILGWWRWAHGGETIHYVHPEGEDRVVHKELRVSRLTPREWVYTALGLVPAYGLTWAADTLFQGHMSAWDSGIMVLSIVAQVLLNEKKLECWWFWIAVNVLSVYTYGTTGLFVVAFQYALFLLNAGYGFVTWRKSYMGQ